MLMSLLSSTIYGPAAIAGVVFVVAHYFGKFSRRNLWPLPCAAVVFLVSMLLLQSWPRYSFESDVYAELAQIPGVTYLETQEYRSLTEPLTWFRPPVRYIRVVVPHPYQANAFEGAVFMYGESEAVSFLADVDCGDRNYFVSYADEEGVFREETAPIKMSEQEAKIFCETDWDAVRASMNG